MWWFIFVEQWNGISLLWDIGLHVPDVMVYLDASGSWGCRAFYKCHWFQLEWHGPVNSEKGKLIKHIISCLKVPVYTMNLRQGTYTSVQSWVESLLHDIKSWMELISKFIDEVSVLTIINFILRKAPQIGTSSSLEQLNYLLKTVVENVPPYSLLKGKQAPIFIVDEENRLKLLLHDQDGQATLESLVCSLYKGETTFPYADG